MTRVLVVHHDVDVADIEAEDLRRAGYEVQECAGPIGGSPCPVLRGEPCWQVEWADALVYDAWATGDGRSALIDDLRDLYPDKPVVLTSNGLMLDWVRTEGSHQVTPAPGPVDRSGLSAAVEAAVAVARVPAAGPYRPKGLPVPGHMPRW